MTLDQILSSDQPYFGGFLISEQGPYELYLPHFRNLVALAVGAHQGEVDPTILEVGSWAGASLATWDQAANKQARLIVVDQWAPYFNNNASETHRIMDEAARSGQIEQLFLHNMKVLGIDQRLSVMRGDSAAVLKEISDGIIDIVFIDGDHRYDRARLDIVNAMPLVRDGGILCGDDLQLQWHEVVDYPHHWHMIADGQSDAHDGHRSYHPGVTQAVYECLGQVSTADRLWAMQKINGEWKQVAF